jgi:23S rRNA (guanine745-N1)-methyltransferase
VGPPPLACSVRGCTLPLERRDRTFVCAARHSYDLARSGYVNLLQPQDRRSASAGDPRAAIEARASLLVAGVGRALITGVATRAASFDLGDSPVVADLGCGSGDALAAVTDRAGTGVGIDLSIAAVERAARNFPDRTWVVANADRRLPLLDRSVNLVLSLHGRRNPAEVARVLVAAGYLLVAVPAADDLIELRELVQGQPVERDRVSQLLVEHEPLFQLDERSVVRDTHELDRDALVKLLRGTYRGVRRGAAERVAALERMRVTLASELVVFRLR